METKAALAALGRRLLPEDLQRTAWRCRVYAKVSPWTSLRSLWLSYRHTGAPDRLLLSKRVLTEIHHDARFDIADRYQMGITNFAPSHPRLGRSKLEVGPEGSVVAPSGLARVGPCSVVYVTGTFTIGNSYISSDSRVICEDEISIGDGCAISWNVEILDTDQHRLTVRGERRPKTAPITIGDDVWIGHDVSIKKGVTVGDGAVVASDSVVTRDVPAGALVAGTPAEVVYEDVEWE